MGPGLRPGAGSREDSPTVWGKCHEVTKGDGPRTAAEPLTRGQRHTARRKAPPDPPWAGAAGRITGLFDDQREYLNQEKYIGNSENYTVEPVQNPTVARDHLSEILNMAAALNQREA